MKANEQKIIHGKYFFHSGFKQKLHIPIPLIEWQGICKAGMLSEIEHYTAYKKAKGADGWFFRTDQEWSKQLGVSVRQVLNLKAAFLDKKWIETKIKKVGRTPKTHYRITNKFYIDFAERFPDPAKSAESGESDPAKSAESMDPAKSAESRTTQNLQSPIDPGSRSLDLFNLDLPPTPQGGNASDQIQDRQEGGEEDQAELIEQSKQPAVESNSSSIVLVSQSEGLEEKASSGAAARRKKTSAPKNFPLDFDQWWVKYREFCYSVDAEPGDRKTAVGKWDKSILTTQDLDELWEGFNWYEHCKKGELGRKGQAIGVPHGCRFLSNEKWKSALDHKRATKPVAGVGGIQATPQQNASFNKFMAAADIALQEMTND